MNQLEIPASQPGRAMSNSPAACTRDVPGTYGQEPTGYLRECFKSRKQAIIFAQPSLFVTKLP